MKPNRLGIVITAAAIWLCASYTIAQNSGSEEDREKVIVLQGSVKSIDWENPVRVHVEVQDNKGQAAHWIIAGDNPQAMVQRGFAQDTLKPGDSVIVCGLRVKPNATRQETEIAVAGGGIALVDGRTLFFGLAEEPCRQAGASQQADSQALAVPSVNSPVQPFVNSPVQPFVSAPVTAFGVAPVVTRGAFATSVDSSVNSNKPVILLGVIQNVEWTNPNVSIHLEVQDGAGRLERWSVSGDSPATMTQHGLAKQALTRGEPVIVCGVDPKTTNPQRNARALVGGGVAFADGRTIYFGQAADNCRGPGAGQPASSAKNGVPIVNSPVQPFVTSPVTRFGVPLPTPRN
jgi:hypothetical protein